MNLPALLALLAGAAIATQASMNARLGVLLDSSMWATAIVFGVSFVAMLMMALASSLQTPDWSGAINIPIYLWFSGGLLAATGVGLFYYLIPRMGLGPMMSYALTGQLIIAIISSHYGWFELPIKPITLSRSTGVIALIVGIVLINKD
ncbi:MULTISPECIES: DMT family transporter [unclassified Ketobacter]|uniref:DMT family transporter n=1 Tax=unclassified Ketobacter TaxID=2639109 RepID=UPI000F2497E2|nr:MULTISPECIES: DMT family transporter [unclassified Ketobacter]RLT90132.1 MAG: DMT family transporter [Ketobacter sp. GenoA1]RLT99143.1 MAG: DMT family transporter [Ketobacter sp.]